VDKAKFVNHRSQDCWDRSRRLQRPPRTRRRDRAPSLPAPGIKAKRRRSLRGSLCLLSRRRKTPRPRRPAETIKLVTRRPRSRRPTRRRSILSGTLWRPSIAGIMRPLSGFLRRSAGRTLLPLSGTHWRPSIAGIMRRLRGFSRRSARKAPLPRRRDRRRRLRRPPSPRHRQRVQCRPSPGTKPNRNP